MSSQEDKPLANAKVLDRDQVERVLLAELVEFSEGEGWSADAGTPIIEGMALDSLEMFELGVRIELRWGVSLRAEDLDDLRTVRDVSEAIVRRLNAASSG